ncbi:hypothetical protein [Sulfitobacter sp. S190]|uniref:globin domain-containing protein n=1 Tax=Sulfitobacter sp. S190 TaxID=2867022 RepID=UPI0021A642D8|nr:hypothetical protein [Sulfitobacter sp. S190]UWR24533.1 hypothetical protein K3756_18965 [Sulfitobacter sp. S190]
MEQTRTKAPQTLFDVAGGQDRIRAMTEAFYDKALRDPLLEPLFTAGDDKHAKYLAGWFSVVFGGPQDYLSERGDLAFVIWKHVSMKITDAQRARWVTLMRDAAAEVDIDARFMGPFDRFIDQISRSVQEHSHMPPDELAQMLRR